MPVLMVSLGIGQPTPEAETALIEAAEAVDCQYVTNRAGWCIRPPNYDEPGSRTLARAIKIAEHMDAAGLWPVPVRPERL